MDILKHGIRVATQIEFNYQTKITIFTRVLVIKSSLKLYLRDCDETIIIFVLSLMV